jgi:sugar lactone lactonase YvrE
VKVAVGTLSPRILTEGLIFGEAPRWHDGRIWASDMLGGRVISVDHNGRLEQRAEVPSGASGLGWLQDGRMVVVSMADSRLLTFKDGISQNYADLSISRGTPNDMVVDGNGRAYVGNAGCNLFAGINPKPTNLVLVENGRAREVAEDLIFPNGMVIDPDGTTLIVAETFAHRLTAFDINSSDGSLSRRRLFADVGKRTPDGICMDAEGAIWLASAETGEFIRVREGGKVTHVVDTGGRFAAACVTGGPSRRSLFMITAHMTPELFAKRATTARIEVADLEVPGAGNP